MSVRKVLIVGSNGLLGQKVTEMLLRGSMYDVTATSVEPAPLRPLEGAEYRSLDITSRKDVRATVAALAPDVIVNTAAMTNVDACEHDRELAWKINVEGVEHLIEAARKTGSRIIHISTDYVFDGKAGPYSENDRPEPLNYYGKTKLASENLLRTADLPSMIIRTIVLYGFVPGSRPNFALWLIDNLERNLPVRVVDDQTGNPTLVDDLAYGIVAGIDLGRTGFYHIAGRDIVSRHEFARRLAGVFGLNEALISPVKTSSLSQPAPRPLQSGLITLKAEIELGIRPSTVEEGLRVLKSQLQRSERRMEDGPPLQSRGGPRPKP